MTDAYVHVPIAPNYRQVLNFGFLVVGVPLWAPTHTLDQYQLHSRATLILRYLDDWLVCSTTRQHEPFVAHEPNGT